ncbi:hypothetical protein [Pedobacter agri]|uniref:Uncharacterized protein n=1 Tax=Pedobacter agri TaxID=454586 RepID=A0A9X3D8R2_9SPHI|nr:hypothetical protein [Pedobacter agri]MCX3263119.1 hypothetical protein [Pedobacter agri]
MAHDPKLTAYTIQLKPSNTAIENSNRWLFRNIISEANQNELTDSFIITEVFRAFISALDTPEMYSDTTSKKCMTANQADIEDSDVNANIALHSQQFIIEGKVEGGSYGRKRNKTSTIDKSNKSDVNERDAITEDFYFLLYCPLQSNKSTLFIQSYSDDSIDSVMKKFWQNFFSFQGTFNQPAIKRFVPISIIEDFKTNATVSGLTFTTDMPGETLLENTSIQTTRNYKVTVKITPTNDDLSVEEFEQTIEPLQQTFFTRVMNLGQFLRKTGTLRDTSTNKTSPFDLGSSFEIQPSILLSKYIPINGDDSDFERIKNYCFALLETVKPEIYIENAIQER